MKYKILDITENDLIKELESQAKLNYEPVRWLKETLPNAYSSFIVYKILFRSVRK